MRTLRLSAFFLLFQILLQPNGELLAEGGPLVYVLPATDRVVIVLGDTPRSVRGFEVYKKGPGERAYRPLTPAPVVPVSDPYQAAQLMGGDFRWLAGKVGSTDPQVVWRKLLLDWNKTTAYCLLSHGLRLALGRTLVDTEVVPGERYRYRVVLLGGGGRTIEKAEENVTVEPPEPPGPPDEVEVELEHGEVIVTWNYPPYRGRAGDRTVGFNVYRREGEGTFERITPAPVFRAEGYLSTIDSKIETGKTYTYAVEAVDIIGAISERALSPPLTPRDTSPPLVPTGLAAVDQDEGVLLVWKISPELDVASYNVYRSESLEEEEEPVRLNAEPVPFDQPRFVDLDIVRGTTYHYRVSAVDRSGNESPFSGPASLTPKDLEPPPSIANLQYSVHERKREVALSWEPLDVPDLLGYLVYRGRSKEGLQRIVGQPLEPEKKPRFRDRGYEERGLHPGASYFYALSAVDTSFNEGPLTHIEIVIPDNVPPGAPLSIFARPTEEGYVQLKWQPDLSRDLHLQRVYRKEGRKFELASELAKEARSWIDRSVERGKTYAYRIACVDTSGNESEPSAEVVVVPADLQPPPPPASLEVELGRRGMGLTWTACPAEDLAGYRVYRAPYPGARWRQIAETGPDKSKYTDRQGEPGWLYGVSALDTSGNEGPRRETQAPEEEPEEREVP